METEGFPTAAQEITLRTNIVMIKFKKQEDSAVRRIYKTKAWGT